MILFGCKENQEDGKTVLQVSAAASLIDVMEEITKEFSNQYGQIDILLNYGSSGKLAKQIEQGAPSDLFLSASEEEMDNLITGNYIDATTVQIYAKNELVFVVSQNSVNEVKYLENLTNTMIKYIAVGEPENVPLGRYTKYSLDKLGLWEEVKDKFVFGKDARQVTTYIKTGNADAGIIYKSDAVAEKEIKIIHSFGTDSDMPIIYQAGIVNHSKIKQTAETFIDFIVSEESQRIFREFGFNE